MANATNGARNHISTGHMNGSSPSVSSSDSLDESMKSVQLDSRARPETRRKHSSPVMPAFMVSAPGKVIVYGEHAVVYGKAAIAASISLRSYLLVTFRSKARRTVTLRFPDVSLNHTWNIDDLPWAVFSQPGKKKYYYDLVTSLDPELVEALQPHINECSPDAPDHIQKIHHSSVTAFLYLFLSLGSKKSSPCIYTLRSTIPIAAGLGSSATIAVCLSAALLLQIRALSGPHHDQPSEESELQIERINRWAFVAEMCIHGNPSGVDNTVSAGGKAVLFQRKDYTKPPLVKSLRDFPELPLLLVNTRHSRSTAVEVAKVSNAKKEHPQIAELILSSIDHVTRSAHDLITQEDFDPDSPKNLKFLGELITINHGLLVSLGVSHPKLERIRALIDHAGIGWTKLTGAGGGGCAITILKPESLDSDSPTLQGHDQPPFNHKEQSKQSGSKHRSRRLQDLEKSLAAEGFELFETTLAGDGVGVLWPAVINNSSGEEGGEEIDEEKFLNAVDKEGIEKLVGVQMPSFLGAGGSAGGGGGSNVDGWRFWRP